MDRRRDEVPPSPPESGTDPEATQERAVWWRGLLPGTEPSMAHVSLRPQTETPGACPTQPGQPGAPGAVVGRGVEAMAGGGRGSEPPASQQEVPSSSWEPYWLVLGPGPRSRSHESPAPALPRPWRAPPHLRCPLGPRPLGSTHRPVPTSRHLKPDAPAPLTSPSTAAPSAPATVPGCHPSCSLTRNPGATPFTGSVPRPGVPDTPRPPPLLSGLCHLPLPQIPQAMGPTAAT